MKIEPSGVFMIGVCDIGTDLCSARENSAITAVHRTIGGSQINVCKPCLDEMVRSGKWEIKGAKVSGMKRIIDLAAIRPDGSVVLAVEAKINIRLHGLAIKDFIDREVNKWREFGIENFLLATPSTIYLCQNIQDPIYELFEMDARNVFNPIISFLELDELETLISEPIKLIGPSSYSSVHTGFELMLKKWLKTEAKGQGILPLPLQEELAKCQFMMEYARGPRD